MITIAKAIEILELNLKETARHMPSDCHEALELSTEALIRVQAGRPQPPSLAYLPLPGEDPE